MASLIARVRRRCAEDAARQVGFSEVRLKAWQEWQYATDFWVTARKDGKVVRIRLTAFYEHPSRGNEVEWRYA